MSTYRVSLILPPADRYLCTDVTCLTMAANVASSSKIPSPPYFPTWSALQAHIRDTHPPTCLYSNCNGRTFNSQKNLKAHLKTHEDLENEQVEMSVGALARRGPCAGRDWQCEEKACTKSFKSVGDPRLRDQYDTLTAKCVRRKRHSQGTSTCIITSNVISSANGKGVAVHSDTSTFCRDTRPRSIAVLPQRHFRRISYQINPPADAMLR